MEDLFDELSENPKYEIIKGDFIDRLYGDVSIRFIFTLLLLVLFRDALYPTIVCYTPNEYENNDDIVESQDGYIHDFCLINGTYYYSKEIDGSNLSKHEKIHVPYYQFILFILIGQMLMFYVPKIIWKLMASNSNGYMNKLLELTDGGNERKFIEIFRKFAASSRRLKPLKYAQGLTMRLFVYKIVNLINSIGQLFLLNHIFNGRYLDYGVKYILKIWKSGNSVLSTKEFPVFTLCDFHIHQSNRRIHSNTVQCILSINVLLEKLYLLIWFWLVILSILTLFNLISWTIELLLSIRGNFLKKYLTIGSKIYEIDYTDEDNIRKFQNGYLGLDGFIMLFIIKSLVGDLKFIKILSLLWKDYKKYILK